MDNFPKRPDFPSLEAEIQQAWRTSGLYSFSAAGNVFSIDTPPPTVSGSLHLGHALSYTHIDIMARYRRMRGDAVFFPMGFDDNGLPTERFVEQQRGVAAKETGRSEFIRICLEETAKAREKYREVWERLGFSVDWNQSYSTIDERCRSAAQWSFVDLYEKGRIERRNEPALWCSSCETTIAEAELEDTIRDIDLVYFDFAMGAEKVPIATTRPELLGACVGVVVHPDDDRYKQTLGQQAIVPLFGYQVPIIPSTKVDPAFGTGAMMVCTFGDKRDVEIWREYGLPLRQMLDEAGRATIRGYEGLSLPQLRQAMTAELREAGLVTRAEALQHTEKQHERCGTNIEYLMKPQWFIRLLDIKKELLDLGQQITWHPSSMRQRYEHWVENLKWDWCISRQRYFGIPFPVWYQQDGSVIVADKTSLPVDPQVQLPQGYEDAGLRPDTDVMDTWMTSSLTPFINARWNTSDARPGILPMSLRPQAHDIIRTWAFYTIAKSYLHSGSIPWRDIVISGHGLDQEGKKMSKSKGNVIYPLDVIEKSSADALRLWAGGVKLGADAPFSEEEIATARATLIKIWNAVRFSSSHLERLVTEGSATSTHLMDRWILDKANTLARETTVALDNYDFAGARQEIIAFFKEVFCDNYVEAVKYRLYADADIALGARDTLSRVLLDSLTFFAPFAPHLTDDLYQRVFRREEKAESIHQRAWPLYNPALDDLQARQAGDTAVEIFSTIRRWKTEQGMGMGREVASLTIGHPSPMELAPLQEIVQGTLRIQNLTIVPSPALIVIG